MVSFLRSLKAIGAITVSDELIDKLDSKKKNQGQRVAASEHPVRTQAKKKKR